MDEKSKKLVVILLIISIMFFVISGVLTLSLVGFKPVFVKNNYVVNKVGGTANPNGGVGITVLPRPSGAAP